MSVATTFCSDCWGPHVRRPCWKCGRDLTHSGPWQLELTDAGFQRGCSMPDCRPLAVDGGHNKPSTAVEPSKP